MKPDPAGSPPQSDRFSELRTIESTLLRYVTRVLTESEAEAFELRLLVDGEFARQVDAAEVELLDEYASGVAGLSSGDCVSKRDLQLLEQWIESSPTRREHVRLTRLLRGGERRVARERPGVSNAGRSGVASRLVFIKRPSASIASLAVAACFLMVAGFLVLTQRHPVITAGLSSAPVAQQAAAVPSASPAHAPVREDVILLAAERLRDAQAQKPDSYVVHQGSPVRLQVLVPLAAVHGASSLSVRRAQDYVPLAVFNDLPVKKVGDLRYLEAGLPAGKLGSGDYVVTVQSSGNAVRLRMHITQQ